MERKKWGKRTNLPRIIVFVFVFIFEYIYELHCLCILRTKHSLGNLTEKILCSLVSFYMFASLQFVEGIHYSCIHSSNENFLCMIVTDKV